jgi:hypothetical protein
MLSEQAEGDQASVIGQKPWGSYNTQLHGHCRGLNYSLPTFAHLTHTFTACLICIDTSLTRVESRIVSGKQLRSGSYMRRGPPLTSASLLPAIRPSGIITIAVHRLQRHRGLSIKSRKSHAHHPGRPVQNQRSYCIGDQVSGKRLRRR